MAGRDSDDDGYKEGVDFEWVQKDGRNYKTRRFFTKAEKEAKKNPKPQAKATLAKPVKKASKAPSSAPTTRPKPRPTPVAKDAMKGYRAGDITTTKLPARSSSGGGRGDGSAERIRRTADAALSRTTKPKTEYTYTEWQGMSREERKKAGLPVSDIGGQIGFRRFMTGITGKDYKVKTK